jgi:RNA polymerase sigma factor (sigma-70 family)
MALGEMRQVSAMLYERLRAVARARMRGQRASHTLDPTGLANEAVLRLLKCDPATLNDEEHFVRLAAEAMRQILIDHARAKSALKRGGSGSSGGRYSGDGGGSADGVRSVALDDADAAGHFEAFEAVDAVDASDAVQLRMAPDELLGLNDALASFERDEPEAASIVKLRTFAGMDCEEIAALIGTSKRTVERRWRYAMAELRARIDGKAPDDGKASDDGDGAANRGPP